MRFLDKLLSSLSLFFCSYLFLFPFFLNSYVALPLSLSFRLFLPFYGFHSNPALNHLHIKPGCYSNLSFFKLLFFVSSSSFYFWVLNFLFGQFRFSLLFCSLFLFLVNSRIISMSLPMFVFPRSLSSLHGDQWSTFSGQWLMRRGDQGLILFYFKIFEEPH